MMKTPIFGISCFNYEPGRLEAAAAVSKILSSDERNLWNLEKAVYEFLGTRKTSEERMNLEAIAGEKFSEEYLKRIVDSSKNTKFTKQIENANWIIFFNEYDSGGKESFYVNGEKVEVEYKSFFSIPSPKDLQKCIKNTYSLADAAGDFADAAEKITIKTDDAIAFKIPRNPKSAVFYTDNIVAYYKKPDTSALVENAFASILENRGIRGNTARMRGFDFRSEFHYSSLNGSHTQLVSRIIAGNLLKARRNYENPALSGIITRQAEELYQMKPKEIALLIPRDERIETITL
jgi:hypothetical protein